MKRPTEHDQGGPSVRACISDGPSGRLCDVCSTIDFPAVFRSDFRKTLKMGRLDRVFRISTLCSLCSHVAEAAREKLAHLEQGHVQNTSWSLRGSPLPPSEYLGRSGIDLYRRIAIIAKPGNDGGAIVLSLLDLYGGPPASTGITEPMRMVRRLIPARFDTSIAKSWLHDDTIQTAKTWQDDRAHALVSLMERRCLRVLDVNTGSIAALNRPNPRYVALSYVWGDAMNTYLRRHRLSGSGAHDKNTAKGETTAWRYDLRELPATVRDAALLARQLGESYLWVDALCIDQSDSQDKSVIIAAMDSIYASASVTIVAACSKHADSGLARINETSSTAETLTVVLDSETALVKAQPSLEEKLDATVWNSRGWTYQERVLSRRCLIITDDEVFFTGSSRRNARESFAQEAAVGGASKKRKRKTGKPGSVNEGLSTTIARFGDQSKNDSFSLKRHYVEAVRSFARRTLTHQGDRLDAFQGILQTFYSQWPIENSVLDTLCGLLPNDLALLSLSWKHDGGPSHRIRSSTSNGRALPSWSWVGWSGPVDYAKELRPSTRETLAVIDGSNIRFDSTRSKGSVWPFEIVPCTPMLYGQVVIHFWMPLLRSPLQKCPGDTDTAYCLPYVNMVNVIVDAGSLDGYPSDHVFHMLPLSFSATDDNPTGYFLFVEPHGGFYERAGMGKFHPHDLRWKEAELNFQHVELV